MSGTKTDALEADIDEAEAESILDTILRDEDSATDSDSELL